MKLKNRKYIALLILGLTVLGSCSRSEQDYLVSRGEGLLKFDFDYEPQPSVMTRSASEERIFRVEIRDLVKDVVIKTINDHRTLATQPVTLREGRYEIKAVNGQDAEAAFDAPYYMGRDTVDVVIGETVTSKIVCTLANVKVTVSFAQDIADNFTGYSVTVNNGNPGGSLTYADGTLGSDGYFRCTGTLFWTVSLVNRDGKAFEVSNAINNVQPRQYYNIHFKMAPDDGTNPGGASIKVVVDGTLNRKEHIVDINLNKKPAPTVQESTGADLSGVLRAPQGAALIGLFRIGAEAGVSKVILSHNSEEIVALGIPRTMELLTADPALRAAVGEKGLTWSDFAAGDKTLTVDYRDLLAQHLPLGTYDFVLNILDSQSQYVSVPFQVKVIPNVEVSTVRIDAWAKFAYVYGQYNTETEPAGMNFQYRKEGDIDWIDFAGELVKKNTTYSAKITGLLPETAYEFRAVTAAEQKDENILSATTEAAAQLPNFSFDDWVKEGKNWYPDAATGAGLFWDSGNTGANTLSELNPTSPESSFVVKGKAVKMVSSTVLGVMAGGNIYSGYFVRRDGTNAEISFGRPYTSRPVSLHGHYAYAPKPIDKVKPPYENLMGTMDVGKIFVILTDWKQPYLVKTKIQNFLNPVTDPSIIAYGELEDNVGTEGQYREFDIRLEYRNDRKPTHVVVVAVASKYADYFTGGIGSTMYVDEFEFRFE